MLSDSCFFNPWWSVVEQNLLSSFHAMISSLHGMIPSFHDMISSFHAVFGLRRLRAQRTNKGGKGFHYRRLFTANVCDGRNKRLQWRMQTFTMADANVYGKKHILLGNQILSGQYLFPEHPTAPEKGPGGKTSLLPYLVWKSIMRAMAR